SIPLIVNDTVILVFLRSTQGSLTTLNLPLGLRYRLTDTLQPLKVAAQATSGFFLGHPGLKAHFHFHKTTPALLRRYQARLRPAGIGIIFKVKGLGNIVAGRLVDHPVKFSV